MTLTSEQARAMNAQPKITVEDRDRLISALAEGRKPDELAAEWGKAVGTIYNFKTRWKAEIDDLRRARTVQFSDIPGVRKQSRLNDSWELRTVGRMLIQKHLEWCFATDPETGEREFVEQLVDNKKLKDYADMVLKANKAIMIETGQQLRLGDEWADRVLGVDGLNGVDYPAIVADRPAREAQRNLDALENLNQEMVAAEWKKVHSADVMEARGYLREPGERGRFLRALDARFEGLTPAQAADRERQYQLAVEDLERICERIIALDPPSDVEGLEAQRVRVKEHWFPHDPGGA